MCINMYGLNKQIFLMYAILTANDRQGKTAVEGNELIFCF